MESTMETTWEINHSVLHHCVRSALKERNVTVANWQVEPLAVRKSNFTTEGIYRLHGTATKGDKGIPWSLVLKIIQPEAEEMNHPQHHNYWKREGLVFQSGLLNHIPNSIQVPECYMVEEKSETEVWIWMEEVKEDNNGKWSLDDFSFIAHQLGRFHGAYTTDTFSLPNHEWVCQNWLQSWVKGCDQYAVNPDDFYPSLKGNDIDLDTIMKKYTSLRQQEKKYLRALHTLPRTLSHQDMSQQNMYIRSKDEKRELILIDWQYMSNSAIGEDLGKLFGVAMSQEDIPVKKAWEYQGHLFNHYLQGLREAGWNGDERYARYGFATGVAFRSAWEVPKLLKLKVQNIDRAAIEKYTRIVQVQMKFAEEIEKLLISLD
ncbi:phosphotransferase [Ornithinibacillus scapharcae]|uniref:phosphotransferase n=1 Tax=Ornithinibacillus scapharcae TaxID=1147159 RepID=UPI000225BA89|nr:phosphotransferase [Ornithinibacillus scapharcae]